MKKRDQKLKQGRKKQKLRFTDIGKSIVIDFYPYGKSLSRRRSEDYNPLAVVVTVDWFQFFDVILNKTSKYALNDLLELTPINRKILRINRLEYQQLSNSALEVLPKVIGNIISTDESRFIKFLNQAHPLTTQMHQLQLLPGIGQKRLWLILEARKKGNFSTFIDFTNRTGISDPISLFLNRILEELKGSQKYSLFTKKKPEQPD